MMNRSYMGEIIALNHRLRRPFDVIELQTSGVLVTQHIDELQKIGIDTVALSIADIFDSDNNATLMDIAPKYRFNIEEVCSAIKNAGLNLRICINLTDIYNDASPEAIFVQAGGYGADQITFRRLYINQHPQTKRERDVVEWIESNDIIIDSWNKINDYIRLNGTLLETLDDMGTKRYSIHGMSTVLFDDCLAQKPSPTPRYYILRPNGKLYTKWDDDGSLIF
jgi:hypothetical protein